MMITLGFFLHKNDPENHLFQLEILKYIKKSHVQHLIEKNQDIHPAEFILRHIRNSDLPIKEIAIQIDCYPRAVKKFPKLHKPGMVYTRKAIEQSTGEALLRFKSRRYSGKKAADLTGGLGMDTLALSRSYKKVDYIEPDQITINMARHNHKLHEIENITHHHNTAEGFLESSKKTYDLLYVDPSRRNEESRFFMLQDCSPDVTELWPHLKKRAKLVVLKLSPMYDITKLTKELDGLTEILVISVHGEVKEILAEYHQNCSTSLKISAVLLNKSGDEIFMVSAEHDDRIFTQKSQFCYVFEPDPAIIKANVSAEIARLLNLEFLNRNTDYMIGNILPPQFPGKVYKVFHILEYKPKKVKRFLGENGLSKVRIHKRDFPLRPEQLYKKFGLEMGNDGDLIFTRNTDGTLICLIANAIQIAE